jgi:MFS family permease
VRGIAAQFRESLDAFRGVFRNGNLRRLELAYGGSIVAEWAFSITLAVYAFNHGGATTVGIVALGRNFVAAGVAPFTGLLGDRFRRERVMLASDLTRGAICLGAAAAAFGGVPLLVYALAVTLAVTSRTFGPAQSALLPTLASSPAELTAANVVSSTIESLGIFTGPAIGGLLLTVTEPRWIFALTAIGFLWSASFLVRIHADYERAPPAHRGIAHEAFAGFRAIGAEPRLRLLVGLYSAQTLVAGALTVYIVVSAIDLLGMGRAGVGFLNSAVGVGGLIGALAAVVLVGRRRLAGSFAAGLLLWGVPIALVGIWPTAAGALVFLGIIGVGNTTIDVACFTMMQRAVPEAVLARAMAVLESTFIAAVGIGGILAPVLVALVGIRVALVATGCFLPALAALLWNRLLAIDAEAVVPTEQLELLQRIPMFAPLPAPTLENLAASMQRLSFQAGDVVFNKGDEGDRFYVIDRGEVEIAVGDGPPKLEGPGAYFGEIALLRDVPRTASVSARTQLDVYALERDEFIGVVTGHAPSSEAAESIVAARLETVRAGIATV